MCGAAAKDTWGTCEPIIDDFPTYSFLDNGTSSSLHWSSKTIIGGNCVGNGEGTQTEYMDNGSCAGDYCCDNYAADDCVHVGEWYPYNCSCVLSPLLIDTAGNGFDLTDPDGGVAFDLNPDGRLENLAWTRYRSDDGFLALDRNGNGQIDDGNELFGSATIQDRVPKPNGFNALRRFDENEDEAITLDDSVFSRLVVWIDANHSGRTEAGELFSLRSLGVREVSLKYHESRVTDANGNIFRYWSHLRTMSKSAPEKKIVDVFLRGR
jgi:hypothetical protein